MSGGVRLRGEGLPPSRPGPLPAGLRCAGAPVLPSGSGPHPAARAPAGVLLPRLRSAP